jgi:hypothetical protein
MQVLSGVDDQYPDTELDYPKEDEVIEKLQYDVNNFILQNNRDRESGSVSYNA